MLLNGLEVKNVKYNNLGKVATKKKKKKKKISTPYQTSVIKGYETNNHECTFIFTQ